MGRRIKNISVFLFPFLLFFAACLNSEMNEDFHPGIRTINGSPPSTGGGTANGSTGSTTGSTTGTINQPGWTLLSTGAVQNQNGNYGTQGVASASNVPASRSGAGAWVNANGDFFLFGGQRMSSSPQASLNDLWTYKNSNWTWLSGTSSIGVPGAYPANHGNIGSPGGRVSPATWVDASGNLFLFGGNGIQASSSGPLNDLWQFDGTNWTWIRGSSATGATGTYGTQGVGGSINTPGGRYGAAYWNTSSGVAWLFGGFGCGSSTTQTPLSDFWKFDGTNWIWVSGSQSGDQPGVYASKTCQSGLPSPQQVSMGQRTQRTGRAQQLPINCTKAGATPGARSSATTWFDSTGNLWIFGGTGLDSTSSSGQLNDLWEFNGTSWYWFTGSNIVNQKGSYGTQNTTASSNTPGARSGAISWIDTSGRLNLFGGSGYDANGTLGLLNDLWVFDGTNWTWIAGSTLVNANGISPTPGTGATTNIPGARQQGVSWVDSSGNPWIFGGLGFDTSSTAPDTLNDLWMSNP